ncbi:hypothetical protein NA57DRAFT_70192 [Rhizodiscina lignyota]|uniref:Glycosylphosphatidylinositol anchor biosynthesis protein 11 n=1 Tax=Rhizodiscina lignyota TaxID=1504668 RepID=A0A9P4ITH3_9PEZI|nr:hypothetical protein NA57DRAFT_70192 [Rhizodiscina lignyota]
MNRHALITEKKGAGPEKSDQKAPPSPAPSPSAPITTLDSGLARIYTHLHPLLVLSLFFFRFQATVEDPVTTLTNGLAPLGILQIIYVVLCLPATGSSTPSSAAKPTPKPSRGKKTQAGKGDGGVAGRTVPAMLSHLLTTLLATPLLTIILILFGAPVTSKLWETLLCAAHMSALAIMPLVYVHGVDEGRWWEVASLMSPVDEVFGAAIGTMVGAWAGAVPIPLDWDREWQKWPVTIVTGAYMGWAVGKLLGGTLLRGKRIDLG